MHFFRSYLLIYISYYIYYGISLPIQYGRAISPFLQEIVSLTDSDESIDSDVNLVEYSNLYDHSGAYFNEQQKHLIDTIHNKESRRILVNNQLRGKIKESVKSHTYIRNISIRESASSFPKPNLRNQSPEERNYLPLHKCRDSGETYSASYIITKEYLIEHNTDYNLTWVNCEMASFIMMNGRADPRKFNISGLIIQSLDVLDLSVIHLSAFERLQRRWAPTIKKTHGKIIDTNIDAVVNSTNILKSLALQKNQSSTSKELARTVVVMPFLGSDMGAGHSKLSNRLQYVHACFWSFKILTPNVVSFVLSQKDYIYARNTSGLPWYDVVLLTGLPKSASLPVATVQQTKKRLIDGTWDFDYIFFTESDQIVMFRIPDVVFHHLKQYPNRFISPHRLMPYPEQVLTYRWNRTWVTSYGEQDWLNMNCCMDRQNCWDRKTWIPLANSSVPILNIYGLWVPLGNSNFHEEKYHTCVLNTQGGWPYCP